jgi:membrane protein implicated in regulation of membrane protease activity
VTIVWIAIGVVLIAVELHHLAFYALFAAVGCFAGAAVASVAPDALAAQVVTAVVVAAAGIVFARGRVSTAVTQHYEGAHVRGVHGGFVGQEVLTLDRVGGLSGIGHVELAGERWRAISGSDRPIPSGTTVVVTAVQGTTLVVWPVDGQPLASSEREAGHAPPPDDTEGEQP